MTSLTNEQQLQLIQNLEIEMMADMYQRFVFEKLSKIVVSKQKCTLFVMSHVMTLTIIEVG